MKNLGLGTQELVKFKTENLIYVDKTEIIYKYHKPKKRIKNKNIWLVYDLIIDGVSIIKTDKAQFQAVLKEHTIDELMEKLRK